MALWNLFTLFYCEVILSILSSLVYELGLCLVLSLRDGVDDGCLRCNHRWNEMLIVLKPLLRVNGGSVSDVTLS